MLGAAAPGKGLKSSDMRDYNPIIIAMGVNKYGEPDAETQWDAYTLLARAEDKGRDGHIAKFDCHKSKVQFCEADGTVVEPPGMFQPGSPALYFLVHASHGNLFTDVGTGDLIEARVLYEAAVDLGKLIGKPFEYINIVACALLAVTFGNIKGDKAIEDGEANMILPLARLFNREQVKPIIAAYRKLVFLEKDGSKRVGVVSEQLKPAQDESNKEYKAVYRFVNGTWLRCKNFHNKAKVVANNVRKFDELPDQWKIIAE
jgi:hypothetical protein